jgi:threonine/homoserine/homoserine lactone efflux protein
MPWPHIGAFAVAAAVIIVIPGPSVLFVVSRGISLGRRGALATVVGNTVGSFSLAALVALGLGSVVARSVAVFNTVKVVGAAYLIWLGVQAWRHRGDVALPTGTDGAIDHKRIVRQGFVVGFTNPKTTVFFAAVLPQFVDRPAGGVPFQMMILAVIFSLIAIACDTVWALAAGTARNWFQQNPARLQRLSGLGGLSIIGLGIRLLFASSSEAT